MSPMFRTILACAVIVGVPAAGALAQGIPNLNNPPGPATELGPVVGDGKITAQPTMRVGQKQRITFQDFPDRAGPTCSSS